MTAPLPAGGTRCPRTLPVGIGFGARHLPCELAAGHRGPCEFRLPVQTPAGPVK